MNGRCGEEKLDSVYLKQVESQNTAIMASLEVLLDAATSPKTQEPDQAAIDAFCQAVLQETNGPQDASLMLLDKVLSPREVVGLKALAVMDACVETCGRPFHQVVGKFKFLNELIKIVSPKYFETAPKATNDRILAMLVKWAAQLPQERKIKEVVTMLRKQLTFPEEAEAYGRTPPLSGGSAAADSAEFEPLSERASPLEEQDKEKAKLLERLLKSSDPNDLIRANKLIKKLVKMDAKRTQRVVKMQNDIELAQNNCKLLTEMLTSFDGKTRLQDDEVIQELYESCTAIRPKLMKLASEVDEKDQTLGDILSTNDDIGRVLDLYATTLKMQAQNPPPAAQSSQSQGDSLLDLEFSQPAQQQAAAPTDFFDAFGSTAPSSQPAQSEAFAAFGEPTPASVPQSSLSPAASSDLDSLMLLSDPTPTPAPAPSAQMPATGSVDLLGDLLGGSSLSSTSTAPITPSNEPSLLDFSSPAPTTAPAPAGPADLSTMFVELATIKPATHLPITAYEKDNMKVILRFASTSPHPDVLVTVASFINTSSVVVNDLSFQAAVPKALQIKLQPASSTTVVPNGAPVTQIFLIANPTKIPIRLRFKLGYTKNGATVDEMGQCDGFPSM
eukprot:m.361040 g.361040  ORF g.361040 m.361040 type:complete len:615 (-) comp19290_c0_seq1:283-2127(-)